MERVEPMADAGFRARFDRERARVLRLRIVVYCLLALIAFGLSLLGNLGDWAEARGAGRALSGVMMLNFAWDGTMLGLYLAALVYLLVAHPDRRRLVVLVTVLTGLVVMASAPLEGFTSLLERPATGVEAGARVRAGWMSVASAGFVAVLALVLVPMRAGEGARIVAPAWVCACVAIVVVAGVPAGVAVLQCGAAGAGVIVGLLWSAWRHREFDERFRSREIAAQLGDMSAELAYARRIHEALFPPPVDRGPVRVAYEYEPMRAIGGDFLFVWPLAFPPSQHAGPVHIVIIDVSGHGVSAALTVNRLHDELRRFFAGSPDGGAGALIGHMNRFVFEQLAPHGVYATALCLRIDPRGGEVEWAGAGHPPALAIHSGDMRDLPSTAPTLGVLGPEEFAAGARRMTLERGARIVAFTDGAFEGLDPSGKSAGVGQLREIVKGTSDPREIAVCVAEKRGGAADDDLLVVEVRLAAT